MIQKLPFALIGLLVLLLAFFLYTEHKAPVPGDGLLVYETEDYTFSYPEDYEVTTTPEGAFVVRRGDTMAPVSGEGPTGVSVVFYPLSEGEVLTDWLTEGESNYELGPKTHTAAKVDGLDAVRYSWSGLYEGDTTAFVQGIKSSRDFPHVDYTWRAYTGVRNSAAHLYAQIEERKKAA